MDISDLPLSSRVSIRQQERRRAQVAAVFGAIQALFFAPFLVASLLNPVALLFFGTIFGLGVASVIYGVRDARIAKQREESER